MKKTQLTLMVGAACLALASCSTDTWNEMAGPNGPNSPGMPGGGIVGGADDTTAPEFDAVIHDYDGQMATDADKDIVGTNEDLYCELNDFSTVVKISYDGDEAAVENPSDKILVHKQGAHVVIDMLTNSVKNVNIELSGATADGSIKIYGEKKFLLTLNGVELSSTHGPAINSQCKKRMFLKLNPGTVNVLSDASKYADDIYYIDGNSLDNEDRKGCLFSEGNIIVSGTGVLQVTGKKKHGIATDGYFYMRPGATIAITEAAKNALHVKGDEDDAMGVTIAGGLLYTQVASEAGKGIKCDMMVSIEGSELLLNTKGDAVYDEDDEDTSSASCIKADGDVIINGGSLTLKSTGIGGKGISTDANFTMAGGAATITTTGTKYYYTNSLTSSPKGVKADGNVTIDGGELNISVTGKSDGSEGLESKGDMSINGGEIYVYAYDDAINAGKAFVMTDGKVFCHAQNNDALDSNGTITISGGLVIASGATSPEESFDVDNSANFAVTGGTLIGIAGSSSTPKSSKTTQCSLLYGGLSAAKDDNIAILDSNGEIVVAYKLHRSLDGYALFVSSPALVNGSYSIQTGGSVEGASAVWQGYYQGGKWNGGSQIASFTISNLITTIGAAGGIGGGGFPDGGR